MALDFVYIFPFGTISIKNNNEINPDQTGTKLILQVVHDGCAP